MQPHHAAILQLHQRGKFLRAFLCGAQLLAADARQVQNRCGARRRRTVNDARLDAAQPQRRPRALFRGISAEHKQFRQHRLHATA
jgi:hypothetical protein